MNQGRPNVLFVDDETDFLKTLLKRMSKRGIDVRGAGSGEEGLAMMRESTSDIIVLDVRMPGMDGIEMLREIKKQWPLTEVIMLTGHASLEAAREGMELGAFDYLMKPVDIDELLFKIEDAFGKVLIQQKKIKRLEEAAESKQD
jgi:DNA-binding NtrC family response regulator